MLRVFKLKENDFLLWILKLKNFEVRFFFLVEVGNIFLFIYIGMFISGGVIILGYFFFCFEIFFKVENLFFKFYVRVILRL